jgi:asparagine synthase (glutamine-hydrolysing)
MCGICGIVDQAGHLKEEDRSEIVKRMNDKLIHRGPDGEGYYSDASASLGMRRLAIIDTVGGDQPIYNEDRSVLVFFNGEIYNYRSLRKKMIRKGHTLATKSDTEVIVHLYESYGEKMFRFLKGMFAICLYDIKKQKFLFGRDRFGEKPFYYHYQDGIFTFSSEVSSLLENKRIKRKLNHDALPYYLRTATIPEPSTLLSNVQSLAPGHFIKLTKNTIKVVTYFRPDGAGSQVIDGEEEAIDFVKTRLEKAVNRQMVSDVPIGAFLSGGIDSSTIVALMQQKSRKPIQTFNVRFEEQAFDESKIAQKVAKYCQTDHHEVVIPNQDFSEELFWEIIDHIGFPFRDTSAIPTYLISKAISKHVKVALSGDGGDELFGGYDIFQWYLKVLKAKKTPKSLRYVANSISNLLQQTPGFKGSSKLRQVKRGIQTSLSRKEVLPVLLSEMFSKDDISGLLGKRFDYALYSPLTCNPHRASDLRDIMYYRMMHVLPVNMLTKVDRMSMANSLEVRTPFLDVDLFQASLEIPDELLIRKGEGKYLIRKIMENDLPKEVFTHKKTGFNMPLHTYMNQAFFDLAKDLLLDNNPWPGFFSSDLLNALLKKGYNQKEDDAIKSVFQSSHQLWMMMQLLGWARRFKIAVG